MFYAWYSIRGNEPCTKFETAKEETTPFGKSQEWQPTTSALHVENVTSDKVVKIPEIDVTRDTIFSIENTRELIIKSVGLVKPK